MHVLEALASQGWTALRYLSPMVLLGLALLFGRTLRPGHTPLIERIARRSTATLSDALCRYTRRLTAIWCGYFVGAASLSAIVGWSGGVAFSRVSLAVLAGSVLLFVGERWLRPRIFPHQAFPGVLQQARDTWIVWRTRNDAGTEARK
jgi:uncharacterized membrane protein